MSKNVSFNEAPGVSKNCLNIELLDNCDSNLSCFDYLLNKKESTCLKS